jgi:ubiquinone/menaquinone biosynthesis C-methylase UbiE
MTAVDRCLLPPPGSLHLPSYDAGWLMDGDGRQPYLSYVPADAEGAVQWTAGLQRSHEENARTHFIDVWTRRAMLDRLGPISRAFTVLDVGCSAGYLLEDLRGRSPQATLIGVDLIASGLRRAHALVPQALLLQADACALPLADASVDAVVSANVLEHVPDDEGALAEICRIMKPGARAAIVVPLGPGNYDYYDRFLGHARRYARGELARKARAVGLEVVDEVCLGALLYPAFWTIKQRNRRRYDHLRGKALERKVESDIEDTRDSGIGRLACSLERVLLDAGVKLPFGIRGLTVLARPGDSR